MPVGAIEGGGTKFLCGIAEPYDPLGEWRVRKRFPTLDPLSTLAGVCRFFEHHRVDTLGVAMFGPLDVESGKTLVTPKSAWNDVDLKEHLGRLNVPLTFETDVNAAALAETRHGAAQGCDPAVYITVGTGIGGGVVIGGRPLHGLLHPEIGHLPIPASDDDDWPGICAFHRRCAEGLAAGPAIAARSGIPCESIAPDSEVWDHVAWVLAQLVKSVAAVVSPEIVVFGGGVMTEGLLDRIRAQTVDGYLPRLPRLAAAHFELDAGLVGARLLAQP